MPVAELRRNMCTLYRDSNVMKHLVPMILLSYGCEPCPHGSQPIQIELKEEGLLLQQQSLENYVKWELWSSAYQLWSSSYQPCMEMLIGLVLNEKPYEAVAEARTVRIK